MIRTFFIVALALLATADLNADGHGAEDAALLPYPERIEPVQAPVNVTLRYGRETSRTFVADIVWGPEKAPGLYRMLTRGEVAIRNEPDGSVLDIAREATAFTYGPSTVDRRDAGQILARVTPEGGYRQIEMRMPELESKAHRDQFAFLGSTLIDTGRVPAFRRITSRTGPNDTGGDAQSQRERAARSEILEALQPMLGFVLEAPPGGASTGTRLTVLRRDFGDLFRDAAPIPLRIDGTVVGLSETDGRRFLVIKLDRGEIPPPMRAIVEGYALIDIETALPETVVATIELVVLQGADATVFRFVERRALLPDLPSP